MDLLGLGNNLEVGFLGGTSNVQICSDYAILFVSFQ